jgi:hypothetical protein
MAALASVLLHSPGWPRGASVVGCGPAWPRVLAACAALARGSGAPSRGMAARTVNGGGNGGARARGGGASSTVSGAPAQSRADTKPRRGDPTFREVWRRFQLRVHPDLFGRFPELAKANDTSLKKLGGVLAEARSGEKSADDFMKPRVEELSFFVRTDTDGSFLRVPLSLRLPGGHCPTALGAALGSLFAACGLPSRFHWGAEYWQTTYALSPEAEEEYAAAEAAAMREAATAAGGAAGAWGDGGDDGGAGEARGGGGRRR